MVAVGSGLTVFMTEPWQLILCWGLLVGLGTGSMSMAFVATITSRWFVARRGLVSGILTAGNATGQLIFLPVVAWLATNHGWRTAAVLAAAAALAVVPLVLLLLRNHPADLGLRALGATDADPGPPPHQQVGSSAGRALGVLRDAAAEPDVLAALRRLRDLRDDHQRPHRHPLRPGRARPRHARHHGRVAARGGRDLRRGRHDRVGLADRQGRPAAAARRLLRPARRRPDDPAGADVAARRAQHVGLHHRLRPRLGGDRAADGGAVPRALRRRRRPDRLRLGLRQPPDRRGRRRDRRRASSATSPAATTRRSTPRPGSARSPA